MQVSQVQDEIHRLVRASGTAADPNRFKQILRPMIDYMYSSMPNLQQASTCKLFKSVMQSPAYQAQWLHGLQGLKAAAWHCNCNWCQPVACLFALPVACSLLLSRINSQMCLLVRKQCVAAWSTYT